MSHKKKNNQVFQIYQVLDKSVQFQMDPILI